MNSCATRLFRGLARIGLLSLLIFTHGRGAAQDTCVVRQLETVEVKTAGKQPVTHASLPVQLLSGERIREMGYQNMGDAVRRFAGVGVKDYGGIGGLKTISVRSLGPHHTAVSYDGVAVGNCQAGQIDLGRFSLDNLESLSLAVGQPDDIFQPARLMASGSVLEIRTESLRNPAGKKQETGITLRGGSFGTVNSFIRHTRTWNPRTSFSLTGNYLHADGQYPFDLKNGRFTTREKRRNTDVDTWSGEGSFSRLFSDSSRLSLKAGYNYSDRGLPGSVILSNEEKRRERLKDENFFAQAVYAKTFRTPWNLKALLKYTDSRDRYKDHDIRYEEGVQREKHRQREYYGSVSAFYTCGNHLSFSGAWDVTVNTLKSGYYPVQGMTLPPDPERYTSQAVVSARYTAPTVRFTATLLHTFVTEHVEYIEEPDNHNRFTPAFSLIFRPWQNLRFRLFYKKIFRVPTFNDLYYMRIGNRNLRPELAEEYGAGVTWSGKGFSFTDYLSFTADVYYNDVKDKIVAIPTTYVWKMQNAGKVRIKGADLTLHAVIPLTSRTDLSLTGAYTWQEAQDVTDPSTVYYKDRLPYTPAHSGNGGAMLSTPWLKLSYTVIGAGKRYVNKQNLDMYRLSGYLEHTAALSREFELKDSRLRLQAELVNFTDKQYDIIHYYPMPGRSFRLTGTWHF